MKRWSVAKAREKFSDLIREAAGEPQEIYNRDRLVAAVVGPETFRALEETRRKMARRSLGEAFADLRKVMAEEGYKLEIPPRKSRKSGFPKVLDELSR